MLARFESYELGNVPNGARRYVRTRNRRNVRVASLWHGSQSCIDAGTEVVADGSFKIRRRRAPSDEPAHVAVQRDHRVERGTCSSAALA